MGTVRRINQKLRLLVLTPDPAEGFGPVGAVLELTIFEDRTWEICDVAGEAVLTGHQDSERDFARWVLGIKHPAGMCS